MTTRNPTMQAMPLVSEAEGLVAQGRNEQAAQVLIEHLRRHPGEPRGLAALGRVAMRLGALGQAEHFLRQALASGGASLEARRDLAGVLNQQSRPADAEALLAALYAESGDDELEALRATQLDKLGRNAEAIALQETLLERRPDRIQLWVAYGHYLRSAGRVDEAVAAYRRAIAIDGEFGDSWWGLASIKRKVLDDDDVAQMRHWLDVAVDVRNTAPLHFALARALHDRGDHAGAFEHYSLANRERAEQIGYRAAELTDEIAEVERIVDPALLSRFPTTPVGQRTPVFIVSLPRSGSTLLEQILGSHSAIEPAGELPYVSALLRGFMEVATRRGPATVPQAIAAMPQQVAEAIGRTYMERAAHHLSGDRPFFIDKLPHNWSNVLFIRRVLPQARFVDIRRPALDCCFSNFTQSFTSLHAASFALEDMAATYRDYVRYMAHLDRVAPGLVHHVRYTDLVEAPRPALEGVLDYLGLPWEDGLLEFHKLERVVRTPSSEQVRRPLNRDGMEVWRPYAQWLGPLREKLGDLAETA